MGWKRPVAKADANALAAPAGVCFKQPDKLKGLRLMSAVKDVRQLVRSPYHLLKRAAQYAADIYMGEVGSSGLTQRQFTVLVAVDQNDGVSQTSLVKLTGIDRSTLADLVARLAAQGYVQRRRDRQDGRANTVRITAVGKKALKTAQPGAEEVDKQILAVIAPAHRKSFVEALASLAAKLDALENVAAGVAEPEPPRAVKRMRRAS